ncbi:MAG: pyruvate kinase [Gammaproteobacteria bacterium]|nr:pyruvate kinase [Gammaproteobacteria bacterium]
MHRERNAKIIATLGPASSDAAMIERLFLAGADMFRLNFSHGSHDEHLALVQAIRALEENQGKPIGVLLDLQGPKLRVGEFADGPVRLREGARFSLDLADVPGDSTRVRLPHPEIFAAAEPGMQLLLDDGRIRLQVSRCQENRLETIVHTDGELSDHKGVNVPDMVLPLPPVTQKDLDDLEFGLDHGVDWVGLSFVQRPEDCEALRERIQGRAALMCKLEKPAALNRLEPIVEACDAVMVARGDLGVELPPEQVPSAQKRIIRACRKAGKPVVVATQMLDSMMRQPVPTRAEASDVATAIYDGADAVMLSGETAVGDYPEQAVSMMERIVCRSETDPYYAEVQKARRLEPEKTTADAICCALQAVVDTLKVNTTVIYTESGFSAQRAARERPAAAILSLTPKIATARRLAVTWGVRSVVVPVLEDAQQMVDKACQTAVNEGFAAPGELIVIAAGMPFGTAGTTNLLRVTRIPSH